MAISNYRSAHNAGGHTTGRTGRSKLAIGCSGLDAGSLELSTACYPDCSNVAPSARPKIAGAKQIAQHTLACHPRSGHPDVSKACIALGLIINSPSTIADHLITQMAPLHRETFRLLYLDTRNRLIADETLWEGTVDHVHIYPREVVRRAIETGATALIIVHNHPHGDPKPSKRDVAMTNQLEQACQTIGVHIHDHVIVGKEGWFSMAEACLLTRNDIGQSTPNRKNSGRWARDDQ